MPLRPCVTASHCAATPGVRRKWQAQICAGVWGRLAPQPKHASASFLQKAKPSFLTQHYSHQHMPRHNLKHPCCHRPRRAITHQRAIQRCNRLHERCSRSNENLPRRAHLRQREGALLERDPVRPQVRQQRLGGAAGQDSGCSAAACAACRPASTINTEVLLPSVDDIAGIKENRFRGAGFPRGLLGQRVGQQGNGFNVATRPALVRQRDSAGLPVGQAGGERRGTAHGDHQRGPSAGGGKGVVARRAATRHLDIKQAGLQRLRRAVSARIASSAASLTGGSMMRSIMLTASYGYCPGSRLGTTASRHPPRRYTAVATSDWLRPGWARGR